MLCNLIRVVGLWMNEKTYLIKTYTLINHTSIKNFIYSLIGDSHPRNFKHHSNFFQLELCRNLAQHNSKVRNFSLSLPFVVRSKATHVLMHLIMWLTSGCTSGCDAHTLSQASLQGIKLLSLRCLHTKSHTL